MEELLKAIFIGALAGIVGVLNDYFLRHRRK